MVQLLNTVYFLVPTYGRDGFPVTITDLALVVGIGGIWLFFYFRRLGARPIVPLHDPRLNLKGADHA